MGNFMNFWNKSMTFYVFLESETLGLTCIILHFISFNI